MPRFDFLKRSEESAIYFDPAEDTARQEFAADSDINRIIKQYGYQAFGVPGASGHYGITDFRSDFTEVVQAQREAREAFDRLPPELRSLRSWEAVARKVDEDPQFVLDAIRKAGGSAVFPPPVGQSPAPQAGGGSIPPAEGGGRA